MMPGRLDGFIDCNPSIQGTCVMGYPVLADEDWLFQEGWNDGRPSLWASVRTSAATPDRAMHRKRDPGTDNHPPRCDGRCIRRDWRRVGGARQSDCESQSARRSRRDVNTAAVVEHDVEVGDFSHVAPNATTGGAAPYRPVIVRSAWGRTFCPCFGREEPWWVLAPSSGTIYRKTSLPSAIRADPEDADGATDGDNDLERRQSADEPAAPERSILSAPHMSGKEQQFVEEAFATNWVAPVGPHLDLFEAEFAAKIGMKHTLAVSSGTAAMHLAIRHLDCSREKKSFARLRLLRRASIRSSTNGETPSSSTAIQRRGPLIAISSRRSFHVGEKKGRLPRAVIAVDLYGQCADWVALRNICGRYEIPLIEDAAEALGASYQGRPAGTFGWANIFSFNGKQNTTTSGGGLLASNDAGLVASARHLSTQARDPAPHYEHSTIGYNYRLSNLLAGIGRAQLQVLDDRVQARRKISTCISRPWARKTGFPSCPRHPDGSSNRWLTC